MTSALSKSKVRYSNIFIVKPVIETINYTESVYPICLSDEDVDEAAYGHIAGWGITKENGFQSQQLLEAVLPVYDRSECNTRYGGLVTDNQFCAGYENGGVDACKGDSGGPFVVVDGNRPKIAGIVSWGRGCARKGTPSVYTKISPYVGWINWAIDKMNGATPCRDPKVCMNETALIMH